jgi:hypothetical protein
MNGVAFLDEDVRFFSQNTKRQIRIRRAHTGERNEEFNSLGFHDPERRRIIAWKVPKGNPFGEGRILKIPYLQFADETIVDSDEVLLPILKEIMLDAAEKHGIKPPARIHNGC